MLWSREAVRELPPTLVCGSRPASKTSGLLREDAKRSFKAQEEN